MLCYTIFKSTLSAMGADGPFIALGVNLTHTFYQLLWAYLTIFLSILIITVFKERINDFKKTNENWPKYYNFCRPRYFTIQLQGVPQKSDILNLDIPGAKLTLNFDLPF